MSESVQAPDSRHVPRPRSRALLLGALVLPVLAAGTALALHWSLRTAPGTAWLLARVPGLELDAPQGALLGDFSARRLSYRSPALQLDLHGLSWRGLRLRWDSAPALWGRLEIDRLQVQRARLAWGPGDDQPLQAPTDLNLPIALSLPALQVDELQLPALGAQPLRQLRAGIWLSEEQGQRHRVELQSLAWDRLQLSGTARIDNRASLPVHAQLALRSGSDWLASLHLQGPLARLQLQAEARQQGQSLQASATLQPFATWPLATAEIQAKDFDLAALHSHLPATALSGQASLQSSGWDQPAELQLALSNARAGRWDQQRLPLQSLKLDLQARPDQLQTLPSNLQALSHLQVRQLEARLGSSALPGGRITASGTGLVLQARVSDLRSAALDARLPQLLLGGNLELQGQPATADRAAHLDLRAQLDGSWQQRPGAAARPVQLSLQADGDGQRMTLNKAQLSAGASQLSMQGQVLLADASGSGWQASFSAQGREFDPRLLWAGHARTPWALGQHSLDASLKGELRQGRGAWPLGQATLTLAPSLLNGASLSGSVHYAADGKNGPGIQAELLADESNRLHAELLGLGGERPQLQAEIDAPKLAGLSPLAGLWDPAAKLSGSVQGRLSAELQGGQLHSEGRLQLKSLLLQGIAPPGELRLASGQLAWQLDSRPDAPLRLQTDLSQLSLAGTAALDAAKLELRGSWAQHQLDVEAQGRLAQPAWASGVGNASAWSGQAKLALTGRLSASPWQAWNDGRTLDWRTELSQLLLRSSRADLPVLLDARKVSLGLRLSAADGLSLAELSPGRLELGGAQLRWSQLQYQAGGGGRPELNADVELEPLAVAPLLARWQPDFGWGGALMMSGHIRVRSAPQVLVDVELGRASGDLSVKDERGVQPLGLSELRLALQAQDGVWHFSQGIAGSNLGVLGGALTSRTSPQALWPAADAPLEGVLQANVANLGTWGGWVPAGWRLGGQVNASMQLAGKVGAPEIIGHAEGQQLALRNPLLGVDLRDGSFALSLNGETATLEHFRAQAGDGHLSAQGQAQLGAKPTARLELQTERFAALGRIDQRLIVSGKTELDLAERSLKLRGALNVDEGLFDFSRGNAPTLDDDVEVLRPAQSTLDTRAARASNRAIDVQLTLDLGQKLRLRGRGLETSLRGQLLFSHQGAGPRLNGTISTAGGTYEAYGQRLEIEKGEIIFSGVLDNPRLDVLAIRPNLDTRVGVTLGGTAQNPRIKLYSDPDMTDTYKLSWLLLGREPTELGRTDTALLQRAALALLSGEGESPSGKLIKNLGLDELSVGQSEDDARSTVVRLGKQISRRWYLGYERGVNATAGSWQLIYRIAQRFTLRAQAGEDSAVDLIWQWRWD